MSAINSAFRYLEDIPVSEEQLETIRTILYAPHSEALELIENEAIDASRTDDGLER